MTVTTNGRGRPQCSGSAVAVALNRASANDRAVPFCVREMSGVGASESSSESDGDSRVDAPSPLPEVNSACDWEHTNCGPRALSTLVISACIVADGVLEHQIDSRCPQRGLVETTTPFTATVSESCDCMTALMTATMIFVDVCFFEILHMAEPPQELAGSSQIGWTPARKQRKLIFAISLGAREVLAFAAFLVARDVLVVLMSFSALLIASLRAHASVNVPACFMEFRNSSCAKPHFLLFPHDCTS